MRKILVIIMIVFITTAFIGCSASPPQKSPSSNTPMMPGISSSSSENLTSRPIVSTETPETSNTQNKYNDELSLADENVLFSFKVENSHKVLSVCVAKDQSYIVYRYGTNNNIELEYPEDKTNSWSKFTYLSYSTDDGPGYDLSFDNGGYRYDIYQFNSTDSRKPAEAYATVTELTASTTISSINGQSNSVVGNLLSLKGNTKVGTYPYTVIVYTTAPNKESAVRIEYPHFNDSSYDKINQIIYNNVQSYITDLYNYISSDETLNLTHQFDVALQNSKMISIIFWGESYASGLAHPNADFYTLNIDLATMKEINLSDMYTINTDFKKVFYSKAQQISGVDDILKLTQSQEGSMSDPFEYPDEISCYLKPDGIVISVPVPHAVGDHFEAQLKYSDIQQFYKLKQNYWDKNPTSDNSTHLVKEAYVEAYTEFLLNPDIDKDEDFPIYGYYLFDMNFDGIPELGVWHVSGGSMGGYFTYYCFDGKKIVSIQDNDGSPARSSDQTQILADHKNKKVYFLKEMYLLQGNDNGTYGYVREIVNKNNRPYVHNILSLEVNRDKDLSKYSDKNYLYEDDFLSDLELGNCIITRCYSYNEWVEISSREYLEKKRVLIPKGNSFVDLRDTDVNIRLYDNTQEGLHDEHLNFKKNKPLTAEQIDTLFSKWVKYIK